tara:strand:+ start:1312 stop:1947 length:636 start_codon:yes stop_codon:yes gene_type:complete
MDNENWNNYALLNSDSVPNLLLELEKETHQKVLQPRMLSGSLQGRLLSLFSNIIRPKTILEIGTYTGYSTICLAEGLSKNGKIHTIDNNEELVTIQNKYFKKSGFEKKICFYLGNAVEIIPKLKGPFELVFIDADKINYEKYFDFVIPKMSKGGLIISDNVMWSGKVLDEFDSIDENTVALKKYNKKLKNDPRVKTTILPFRDGLSLSWVI